MRTFSGEPLDGVESELNALLDFARSRGVRRYLEVGAGRGDRFHFLLSSLPLPAFGFAVDLPAGAWGAKGTERDLLAAVRDLQARGCDANSFIGNSRHSSTLNVAVRFAPYDLTLLAADPSYAAAAEDFSNYGPFSRFVAFADIANVDGARGHNGSAVAVEVPRLWNELKTHFTTYEFVAPGSRAGIGVLETGLM